MIKKILTILFLCVFVFAIGCSGDDSASTDSTESGASESGSSETTETQGTDTNEASDYDGKLPAPEGVILTEYYGEDQFKAPTGDGVYRFKLQTSWRQPVACKDDTRTIRGSKGKSWEAGFFKGHQVGTADYNTFPKPAFDDAPTGSGAGNEYYDEGYRWGYGRGYEGMSTWTVEYSCPDRDVDLSDYDADGWLRYDDVASANGVVFYAPPPHYSGLMYSSQSVLGPNSKSFGFNLVDDDLRVDKTDLNAGTAVLNLGRIDILEGQLEGEEQGWTTEEFAQRFYGALQSSVETRYKNVCTLSEPSIETQTHGANTFVQLTFVQMCKKGGSAGMQWNMHAYAFMRNGNDQLNLAFYVPHDIKQANADDFDLSKLPSTEFIAQFLSKIEYN